MKSSKTSVSDENVNKTQINTISIHESNEIISDDGTKYILKQILGRGTFGLVYLAYKKDSPKEEYAIKRYFKNLHPNLCLLEISILSYLNQKPNTENIVKLYDGFYRNQDLFLIMSYQPHQKFNDYYCDLSPHNIKIYMKELLTSLAVIHKHGIIHRDIKPDNFLFNFKTGKAMLIDFGLAEGDLDTKNWIETNRNEKDNEDYLLISELQKNNYRHRTGTRGFLAPEIIFHGRYQGCAVDVWAAGVIFLSFLTQRFPVFNLNKFSKITDETIKEIIPLIIVFGKDKVIETAQKYKNFMYVSEIFEKYKLKCGLDELLLRKNDIGEEGIDLPKQMLELDSEKRITAEQALNHGYFNKC